MDSLARSLREVKEEVGELKKVSENHETSIKSNADEIKKLKSLQEKNEKSLENLKKSEEKQDKRIDDLENLTNSHGSTLSQQHSVIDHHSSEIETIKKLISALNPSAGVSVDLLSEIQAQIRSVDEKHSKVEDKHSSRITDLENAMKLVQDVNKKLADEVKSLKQMLSNLEDQVKSKADKSDLNVLKNLPSGTSISDVIIDELRRELENLKRKTENSINSLTSNQESLTKRVSILEDRIKSKVDQSELSSLLKSSKQPESVSKPIDLSSILHQLQDHEEKILALLKMSMNPGGSDAEIWIAIKELRSLIDSKANLADLKSLEERLQEKVIAVCEAMGNKFADRADTKKALKFLETMIREIIEFGSKKPSGDDAMFAKKPLGGWSCASCETNLEKLKGIAAAYYSWNKMPFRDPSDRIARAGPGFSRMLATIQPDALGSRVKTAKNKINSQLDEDVQETRPPTAGKKVVRPMSAYHH